MNQVVAWKRARLQTSSLSSSLTTPSCALMELSSEPSALQQHTEHSSDIDMDEEETHLQPTRRQYTPPQMSYEGLGTNLRDSHTQRHPPFSIQQSPPKKAMSSTSSSNLPFTRRRSFSPLAQPLSRRSGLKPLRSNSSSTNSTRNGPSPSSAATDTNSQIHQQTRSCVKPPRYRGDRTFRKNEETVQFPQRSSSNDLRYATDRERHERRSSPVHSGRHDRWNVRADVQRFSSPFQYVHFGSARRTDCCSRPRRTRPSEDGNDRWRPKGPSECTYRTGPSRDAPHFLVTERQAPQSPTGHAWNTASHIATAAGVRRRSRPLPYPPYRRHESPSTVRGNLPLILPPEPTLLSSMLPLEASSPSSPAFSKSSGILCCEASGSRCRVPIRERARDPVHPYQPRRSAQRSHRPSPSHVQARRGRHSSRSNGMTAFSGAPRSTLDEANRSSISQGTTNLESGHFHGHKRLSRGKPRRRCSHQRNNTSPSGSPRELLRFSGSGEKENRFNHPKPSTTVYISAHPSQDSANYVDRRGRRHFTHVSCHDPAHRHHRHPRRNERRAVYIRHIPPRKSPGRQDGRQHRRRHFREEERSTSPCFPIHAERSHYNYEGHVTKHEDKTSVAGVSLAYSEERVSSHQDRDNPTPHYDSRKEKMLCSSTPHRSRDSSARRFFREDDSPYDRHATTFWDEQDAEEKEQQQRDTRPYHPSSNRRRWHYLKTQERPRSRVETSSDDHRHPYQHINDRYLDSHRRRKVVVQRSPPVESGYYVSPFGSRRRASRSWTPRYYQHHSGRGAGAASRARLSSGRRHYHHVDNPRYSSASRVASRSPRRGSSSSLTPRHSRRNTPASPRTSPAAPSASANNSDAIIHFDWHRGLRLGRRFVVRRQLGEGTFGRVLECTDVCRGGTVAVKVVRDVSRYTKTAQIEGDILEEVARADASGESNCVRLYDRFFYDVKRRRACSSRSARRELKRVHPRRKRRNVSSTSSPPINSAAQKTEKLVQSGLESKTGIRRRPNCSSPQPSVTNGKKTRHHPSDSSTSSSATSSRRTSLGSSRRSPSEDFAKGVHMCLVSERLGLSLFDFLMQNKYRGFFVADIQKIAYEILKALAFLYEIRLTHTDLKLENILFVNSDFKRVTHPRSQYPRRFWDGDSRSDDSQSEDEAIHAAATAAASFSHREQRQRAYGDAHGPFALNSAERSHERKRQSATTGWTSSHQLNDVVPPVCLAPIRSPVMTKRPLDCRVKLIDFGSATFEDDHHCRLINTRQYRAPEVILKLGWSMSSDMWCVGCVLMELYTGVLLFTTSEHLEHLAMMEKIIKPFPQNMLATVTESGAAHYIAPRTSEAPYYRLNWPQGAQSNKSIQKVSRCRPLEEMVLPRHRVFADFVRSILVLDPKSRPTPAEALRHPFFHTVFNEG